MLWKLAWLLLLMLGICSEFYFSLLDDLVETSSLMSLFSTSYSICSPSEVGSTCVCSTANSWSCNLTWLQLNLFLKIFWSSPSSSLAGLLLQASSFNYIGMLYLFLMAELLCAALALLLKGFLLVVLLFELCPLLLGDYCAGIGQLKLACQSWL